MHSLNDLIDMNGRTSLFLSPIKIELLLDMSKKPRSGGFKQAIFGSVVTPKDLFTSGAEICVKQTFYKKDGTTVTIPHPRANQLVGLSVEANCLAWAVGLLDLVNNYMTEHRLDAELSSVFNLPAPPDVRFIEAGIAVEQGQGTDLKVFLVEERIPGKYIKFIHNRTATPELRPAREMDFVMFLSFTQHLQYQETDRLAFISDYQGLLCHRSSLSFANALPQADYQLMARPSSLVTPRLSQNRMSPFFPLFISPDH
jgi:hypothetical protein